MVVRIAQELVQVSLSPNNREAFSYRSILDVMGGSGVVCLMAMTCVTNSVRGNDTIPSGARFCSSTVL